MTHVYIFQPAQRENGIFFTESVKPIQGLSSVSSQGWYTSIALSGSRGVVQLIVRYMPLSSYFVGAARNGPGGISHRCRCVLIARLL